MRSRFSEKSEASTGTDSGYSPPVADSFTMKPKGLENGLRLCGVIDLCCGVILFLFGLALMAVGTWQGFVAFFGSLLVLWAGTAMTWSRVYVTPQRILTTSPRLHRAKKQDIQAIDICRSDFGQIKQIVPLVKLKSGRSFRLSSLCISFGNKRDSPQFRERAQHLLPRQQTLVEEMRSRLGVGGSNYSDE